MANPGVQYPFLAGGAPLPPYKQLKEEQGIGLGVIDRNVPVASAVVEVDPQVYGPTPRDHVVWSILTTLYLNFCCLGLMVLAFSVKAPDRKMVGDHSGARSYGSTSRCLNIVALTLSFLSIVLVIIAAVIAVRYNMSQGFQDSY